MRSSRLLLVLAVLLLPGPARAFKRSEVAGVDGRYLYWVNRTIGYAVYQDPATGVCKDVALSEAFGAIRRSFFTWASPSCTDLNFLWQGTTTVAGKRDPPDRVNLIRWHTTWPPADLPDATSEMPALTTVKYERETGAIIDVDIDLNAQDFAWSTTDDQTKAWTDVQNILTHEIGHLLGLAHSEKKAATMYATTKQGELSKRDLDEDDRLGLCTIYPFGAATPADVGGGVVPQDVEGGCELAGGATPPRGSVWGLWLAGLLCWRVRSRRAACASRRAARAA